MAKKNIKKNAFFITVEGIEGSGKSSAVCYIRKFLSKRFGRVEVFREPGSTGVGERIRRILLDKKNSSLSPSAELLLYLASRVQLIDEKLKSALKEEKVVVCDRFFDSTLVYQGYALGLGVLAEKAVRSFSSGFEPDLTILLDLSVAKAMKRINRVKDRIESRPLSYHRKIRDGYLFLARKYPRRIRVIDSGKNFREVCGQIESVLNNFFDTFGESAKAKRK